MEECVFALENADVLLDLEEDTATKVTGFIWSELEMKCLVGPTGMSLLKGYVELYPSIHPSLCTKHTADFF